MDNQQQFLFQLDILIHFIYSKKDEFASFSRHVFGAFKTSNKKTIEFFDNRTDLDCNLSSNSLNIFDVFINLLTIYIELKKKEVYFCQDTLFFKITELCQIFSSSSNNIQIIGSNIQPEQKNSILSHLNNLNNILATNHRKFNSSNNHLNSTNNSFRRKKLEDINPSNFIDFNLSKDFLSRVINKKLRYNNHIKIINSHKTNGTTPSSLFFNKFPRPFLIDDSIYVEKYNQLIHDFQTKTMDLILDRLNSRVECIDQKLDQIKQNLIDKGLDINICNQNFSKLEIDNNKSLETQFKNANEKVLRSSNKPFVVGQIFKQNISSNFNSSRNNSNNNDTLASGTSSLNSHISSRSVRIDPERNRFSTYNQHSPISSRNSSNNNYNNRNNNYNNNRSNYNRHNDNHYSRRNNNFRTNTNSNHFNAYD